MSVDSLGRYPMWPGLRPPENDASRLRARASLLAGLTMANSVEAAFPTSTMLKHIGSQLIHEASWSIGLLATSEVPGQFLSTLKTRLVGRIAPTQQCTMSTIEGAGPQVKPKKCWHHWTSVPNMATPHPAAPWHRGHPDNKNLQLADGGGDQWPVPVLSPD